MESMAKVVVASAPQVGSFGCPTPAVGLTATTNGSPGNVDDARSPNTSAGKKAHEEGLERRKAIRKAAESMIIQWKAKDVIEDRLIKARPG